MKICRGARRADRPKTIGNKFGCQTLCSNWFFLFFSHYHFRRCPVFRVCVGRPRGTRFYALVALSSRVQQLVDLLAYSCCCMQSADWCIVHNIIVCWTNTTPIYVIQGEPDKITDGRAEKIGIGIFVYNRRNSLQGSERTTSE